MTWVQEVVYEANSLQCHAIPVRFVERHCVLGHRDQQCGYQAFQQCGNGHVAYKKHAHVEFSTCGG